jgi:hypothetical protein
MITYLQSWENKRGSVASLPQVDLKLQRRNSPGQKI